MGDRGTHTAGVSTGYPGAPGPATPGSDDPPPYSACVPNPPTFASNGSEKYPPLPAYTPVHQPNGVPYDEAQAGSYVHDTRASAPFVAASSESENRPNVHIPTVSPHSTQPPFNPYTSSQSNPAIHRHPPKTIVLQNGNTSRRRKSPGSCTKILVCITVPIIILACIIRVTQRTRHRSYDSSSYSRDSNSYSRDINSYSRDSSNYGRDSFDTYRETNSNPVYNDPYSYVLNAHEDQFNNVIARDALEKLKERLNADKIFTNTYDTSQNENVKKKDNDEQKNWSSVDEMMRDTLRKFGPNKEDDDYYRNTDMDRLIQNTINEIMFGPRKLTAEKSTTETSVPESTTEKQIIDNDP